jgi:hypothetical protein
MPTLDEHIARALQESLQNGELKSARSWGKPLEEDPAFSDTPEEFRVPFKILKDAGYIPAEIQMIKELAALRTELDGLASDNPHRGDLQKKIIELQLKVSIRLESMKTGGGI